MSNSNLDHLKAEVQRLAAIIGAPARNIPPVGQHAEDDKLSLVVEDSGFRLTHRERGRETDFCVTNDMSEVLYAAFNKITSAMSSDYELLNRKPNEDSRRQRFLHQRELLASLEESWAARFDKEIEDIL